MEQAAEKINPTKDYFDVSSIWGKWPALKIVRWIYNTPVTPPQVSIIAFLVGVIAAYFLAQQKYLFVCIGALLVQVKNIFDTVDGHLARARNTPSRIGRFLDSIIDFITNLAFFIAIGWHLAKQYPPAEIWILSIVAFFSSLLQCSYYVFYTVSYIHKVNRPTESRAEETVRKDDYSTYSEPHLQKLLIILQKIFLIFYGWQDRFMIKIDRWSLKSFDNIPRNWYLNEKLLTMTSWMGLGMQLFFISLLAILDQLYLYLWFIIIAGNLYWLFLICYRKKGKIWMT